QRARDGLVRRAAQPVAGAGFADRVAPADRPDADRVDVGVDVRGRRVAVGNAFEALDEIDATIGCVTQRSGHVVVLLPARRAGAARLSADRAAPQPPSSGRARSVVDEAALVE